MKTVINLAMMGPISIVKSHDKGQNVTDVNLFLKYRQDVQFHDFVCYFAYYPECEGGYADAGLCEGGNGL